MTDDDRDDDDDDRDDEEDEEEEEEDEDEDVLQVAALDVLLHTVKATCEGLIDAVKSAPHVHPIRVRVDLSSLHPAQLRHVARRGARRIRCWPPPRAGLGRKALTGAGSEAGPGTCAVTPAGSGRSPWDVDGNYLAAFHGR